MLIVFGTLLILFMVWYAYHTRIAALVLAVRMGESWVITLFTSALLEDRAWMKYIPRSAVTFDDMVNISTKVGRYVRWVTVPILFLFGIYLFRKSPTERFRRKFTEKTLPQTVGRLYPWMRISLTNNFSEMDLTKGPWAIALTERQFARLHRLKNDLGEIDRERAALVFVKQMGSLFMGVESMRPHVKALYVLFLTRANRNFKAADTLLKQLANSYADKKPDLTGVDALLAQYKDSKVAKELQAHHAYERTLLMTMLERSRGGEAGKDNLPPNWFLWLKGVDRPLWYALADVGRRTPHVEAAGVFAHWLTEKARKKKLETPYVVNAVEGLVGEIKKFLNDDDQHEEGFSDTDDVREFEPLPPHIAIPSPEQVAQAFMTGKGGSLPKPVATSRAAGN